MHYNYWANEPQGIIDIKAHEGKITLRTQKLAKNSRPRNTGVVA